MHRIVRHQADCVQGPERGPKSLVSCCGRWVWWLPRLQRVSITSTSPAAAMAYILCCYLNYPLLGFLAFLPYLGSPLTPGRHVFLTRRPPAPLPAPPAQRQLLRSLWRRLCDRRGGRRPDEVHAAQCQAEPRHDECVARPRPTPQGFPRPRAALLTYRPRPSLFPRRTAAYTSPPSFLAGVGTKVTAGTAQVRRATRAHAPEPSPRAAARLPRIPYPAPLPNTPRHSLHPSLPTQPVYTVALNADGSATLTPPPAAAGGGGCCSLC